MGERNAPEAGRFRRAPSVEDGRFGLGLGLLLVRQTAALHGGALLISEAPEGGTIAALSFRRNLPASGAFRSPMADRPSSTEGARRYRLKRSCWIS